MSLPSELLFTILSHLPVSSLLDFSATCRTNQTLACRTLQTLNLAVLPSEIQCSMALMSRRYQQSQHHSMSEDVADMLQSSVSKTTDIPTRLSKDSRAIERLEQQITAQNDIAADILGKESLKNLRSLSLHMYDLQSADLASVMATKLVKLRHLELNFAHPYIHDQCLPANYWHEAPSGSSAWNALVGLGQANQQKLRMRSLLSLHVKRAGLTSTQLRKLIESNPLLRRIHLENVTGVDLDFVQWLAAYCESGKSGLEQIVLERCPQLKMQRLEDFAWLAGITESEVSHLSLFKCRNVRHDIFVRLIEESDEEEGLELDLLETLIPPKGPARHFGVVEEISSRPVSVVMQTGFGSMAGAADKIDIDPEYMALSATA